MCIIVSATILNDVVTYKRSVVILTKKIVLIQSILLIKPHNKRTLYVHLDSLSTVSDERQHQEKIKHY